MSSRVQICNYALSRIGGNRITSLSDNTNEARICSVFIDDAIDEVLIKGPWAFSVRRAALNQTTTTPAFGYDYEYQLPTNLKCLRVLRINESIPGTYEFSVESDKLLTDLTSVKIKYIAKVTDVQSFSPQFEEALKTKMQALLAYSITGDKVLVSNLEELFNLKIQEGLTIDGQQGSNEIMVSPDLTEVR